MRHEQSTRRYLSTMLLTAVVTGMLYRRRGGLGKPAEGSVSEWRTADHLRSGFLLRRRRAEGHAICQLRGRSGRWSAAADHDRPDVRAVPDSSARRTWPVVMVHGSTHTGAALDSTPDGREGWYPYFVRNGLATYVVDQSGRGRSGFDQSVLLEAKATGNWNLVPSSFGRITDDGAWTTWFGHIVPAGTDITTGRMIRHGDPGDPDPAENPAEPSQAHGVYPPAFPIPPVPNSANPRLVARAGAIGEAPNPSNNAYLGLEYYKQLVPNGEVTLPGSVCASCASEAISMPSTRGFRSPSLSCWKASAAASCRRIRNRRPRSSIRSAS